MTVAAQIVLLALAPTIFNDMGTMTDIASYIYIVQSPFTTAPVERNFSSQD